MWREFRYRGPIMAHGDNLVRVTAEKGYCMGVIKDPVYTIFGTCKVVRFEIF